ncbi:cation-transporting P-type ATPase [Thalassospira alkalitolerans]|uniref:cation-transporting P-type ATPase n=1 Tax=Thalassospira alkalitolerans TaxID=1293890 RepID=UPI0030ED2523
MQDSNHHQHKDLPPQGTAWHAVPVDAVLDRQNVAAAKGLGDKEASERLAAFGPNVLRPPRRRGPVIRFLLQFHNVLIYVLLGAALVTAALTHWVDTAVIAGVVVINAVIGFIQEGKAERALEAIRKMLSLYASVMRGGKRIQIPAEDLVPGDIVYLQSGDKVPADLRLLRVKTLQIQEAVLTGESLPVEKDPAVVAETADLGDRSSMAYSGTLVTYGQATGVVVATGEHTEIGRISSMLAEIQTLTTPLLRQLAIFGRWLMAAIIVIAAATFGFGVLVYGNSAAEMFIGAVGLAVAAIPEGLPAIMTITLAIGVQRMARRKAIIRRLPVVEALGSVSVICSDKTGTLTRNEMTVQSIATSRHLFSVKGVGYVPVGEFVLNDAPVSLDHRPLLSEMARGVLLCSDAGLRQVDEEWIVDGDPTEGALVVVAMKAGLDPEFEAMRCPRSDVIPFESEHRFMATLHHNHDGQGFIYVKGAPERIFEMCDQQRSYDQDEPIDRTYWEAQMAEIAARGQRVLALASRPALNSHRELRFGDVEKNLVLIGLFGLADPPRAEAIKAVAECRSAGIEVKMITGDHALTARAIAAQLGLGNTDVVLTGHDIDQLDDHELAMQIRDTHVFARTSPQHKLRLVETLQSLGHVVAMTGDGVNDAPALKRADVGVAMGVKGTEAAKEAAEMVLADDNFASIAHAVEEGRTVYDNLKKSIMFILPTNGGEALTIVAAIALGQMLPITPVQILWVNMITAVTLALALAFEPAERDVMLRPPRSRNEPILSRFLVWRTLFVSVILVVGTFGMFLWQRQQGASVELARTAAVNTLVMFEVFYLLNARFLRAASFNFAGIFGSRPVLVAIVLVIGFQLLFTYAPPMQFLFKTVALDAVTWGAIVVTAASVFVLVEIEKYAVRRFFPAARPQRP